MHIGLITLASGYATLYYAKVIVALNVLLFINLEPEAGLGIELTTTRIIITKTNVVQDMCNIMDYVNVS